MELLYNQRVLGALSDKRSEETSRMRRVNKVNADGKKTAYLVTSLAGKASSSDAGQLTG